MADKTKTDEINSFYQSFHTLPKLISDLALSIAEAQRRLEQDYVESLAEISKTIGNVKELAAKDPQIVEQYLSLLRALAPSRYQFTETSVEVRADLQMSSLTEFKVAGELGIKAIVFAATVNASYAKRSAYDYQASAHIRTVLHAVPADPAVLTTLLERAKSSTELPSAGRYAALAEAFGKLLPPAKP